MNFLKIKRLCYERCISIAALERECGLGNGLIATWRDGANPRVDKVKAVADFFGVTVDELLKGGEDDSEGT